MCDVHVDGVRMLKIQKFQSLCTHTHRHARSLSIRPTDMKADSATRARCRLGPHWHPASYLTSESRMFPRLSSNLVSCRGSKQHNTHKTPRSFLRKLKIDPPLRSWTDLIVSTHYWKWWTELSLQLFRCTEILWLFLLRDVCFHECVPLLVNYKCHFATIVPLLVFPKVIGRKDAQNGTIISLLPQSIFCLCVHHHVFVVYTCTRHLHCFDEFELAFRVYLFASCVCFVAHARCQVFPSCLCFRIPCARFFFFCVCYFAIFHCQYTSSCLCFLLIWYVWKKVH